ncbi:TRAP transporter large permease subunit [Acuticoccus yangtzensis]|uniref:TRAP transporter large permease subunit n=1 Tax=Acuticoccus yangtzensis TaxID=1443441 RepID=UPI000ADC5817|nr:TRAP transporter large permease subunit [Acuticoccus yangtzensis]
MPSAAAADRRGPLRALLAVTLRRPGLLPRLADGAGALLLGGLVAALALNIAARWFGLPVVGASLVAGWIFTALAFSALPSLMGDVPDGPRGTLATALTAFAVATIAAGLIGAATRLGGTEAVLAIPRGWRYVAGAVFAIAALAGTLHGPWTALGAALGIAAAVAPLPPQGPLAGAAVFALALALRVPVALALVAGVAVAPGRLSDAALAQNVMRGLSPYVLLAIPLFILSASLMLAGGVGDKLVAASTWFARRRRTALGEANVIASTFFGGVSGSSIADAALGARLLVPAMVAAGYPAARAAAITAASAVLPNILPPSIALLLAAAATDQSVGALWIAGLGGGLVLAAALWLAVRITPVTAPSAAVASPAEPPAGATTTPTGATDADAAPRRWANPVAGIKPAEAAAARTAPVSAAAPPAETGAAVLWGLVPPLIIAVTVLGGLRFGLVTSVEAGLAAALMSALFAAKAGGRALVDALGEAARQSGRVALLIGAAAPVGFVFATSGLNAAAFLPDGPPWFVLAAAAAIALVIGTVLDVGAAILLLLPVLVPAAGGDMIHTTLVLTVALLLGGLTPPVGILVLVVKDITHIGGVYRAVLPYLTALTGGLALLIALPALTSGLARLF